MRFSATESTRCDFAGYLSRRHFQTIASSLFATVCNRSHFNRPRLHRRMPFGDSESSIFRISLILAIRRWSTLAHRTHGPPDAWTTSMCSMSICLIELSWSFNAHGLFRASNLKQKVCTNKAIYDVESFDSKRFNGFAAVVELSLSCLKRASLDLWPFRKWNFEMH